MSPEELEQAIATLPNNATMRDLHDFCMKWGINSLAQGMIELPPPEKLRARVTNTCMDFEVHQYRNRYGEEAYRQAVVALLKKHYNVNAAKDNILATAGVSGGIVATLTMLRNEKGDVPLKVGMFSPFYTYHMKQVFELTGQLPIFIPTNEDFTPKWDEVTKALKQDLDVILLTNPGNPQGNVWDKDDLRKLVQLTKDSKCHLLIDEIYCDLVWRGEFFSPINDSLYDHVIVCRGFSKTLGAQSWRVGYLVSSANTINKIMKIHDFIYISVSWLQHAIADYLNDDYADFLDHITKVSQLMQDNWKKLSNTLHEVLGWDPIEPSGSMYGLFKHHEKTDKEAVIKGIKIGICVAPGNIFFADSPSNSGYVRIHCGISSSKTDKIIHDLISFSK